MKLHLKNVRISFPDVFNAKAFGGDDASKPSFGASFLFAKTHPQMKEINAAIEAAAKEKWGPKAETVLKGLRAADKVCLHDGDLKDYDGYAGNLFISARSNKRPTVVDADRTPLTEADGRPYGGCYVNAILEVYAQDNGFGKRVNASLGGVQFVKDGEAFAGSAPVAADEFEDVTADALAD